MEYVSRAPLPNEVATDYHFLGDVDIRRGRQLFLTGATILCGALVYLTHKANVDDPVHLGLGLIIFTLAVLPSLLWARNGGSRFPVFETIMILCANAYAMPVLNAHEQLAGYAPEVITRACMAVILYQASAILTYLGVRGIPGRSPFWRESLISQGIERIMIYGVVLSTAYVWISTFTTWIPAEAESVLRAVFYGVAILCTFVGAQRWGRGELTQQE